MSQINLLSNQSVKKPLPWQLLLIWIVRLLTFLAIVSIVAWVGLYFYTKNLEVKIYETQNNIKQEAESLVDSLERKELVTRQGQIKAYDDLVKRQTLWSVFLEEKLAKLTLKTARYISINADNTGKLTLSVSVPSYADLDKYIQVFNQDSNKVFRNIRVSSLSKSQAGDKLEIRFDVTMEYDPSQK